MSFTDPKLAASLQIQNPADPWKPLEAAHDGSRAYGVSHSSTLRATMHDGQLTSEVVSKQQSNFGESIEAQYRATGTGIEYAVDPRTQSRIAPYDLKDDSIVFIQGVGSMSFASAKQAGFVAHNYMLQLPGERGTLVNPPTEASQQQQQQQPKQDVPADLQAVPLADSAVEQSITALVDNTGGFEQHQAIQQIVETGAITERTLSTLADQLKCEPGQLQATIAPIMQAMEQQARAVMSEGGTNSDDVVAWAQENCPDKLNRAMQAQGTKRVTSGYADIRQSYLESLGEYNPEAALAADLGAGYTSYLHEGKVVVRTPQGATMLWRSAISAFGAKKA